MFLLRGHEGQRAFVRILFWLSVSAVPWIAGALAHGTARVALWMLAVAVDYTAIAFRLPTPGLGRVAAAELAILGEHVAERYRQFFIIALGELILVTGQLSPLAGSSAGSPSGTRPARGGARPKRPRHQADHRDGHRPTLLM